MDILFGADVSHHKENFDMQRAAREGLAFMILKATEGSSFVDAWFARYLAAARAAGLQVIAYHYQIAGISAAAQVDLILRTVPADVPLAIDVEARSGSVSLTREIVTRLRAAGRRVVLTYLPRWYWQQIGRPDLSGLPPLWSSRYPDTIVGSISDEWADVPASYWDGYGGLQVALLQFTSSAAISNYTAGSIDGNAFRGTRTQLAALLGGTTSQEDDMDQNTPVTFGRLGMTLAYSNWIGETWDGAQAAAASARRVEAVVAQIAAAIAAGDLDPDAVLARMDTAVREATQEAIGSTVLPALRAVVHEVLGEDNTEQADAIVTELAERLRPAA